MPSTDVEKESLWKRVEDARLRWLKAHNDVREMNANHASIPNIDGGYAYSRAIHTEALAVKDYLYALREFQAAVSLPSHHTLTAAAEDKPVDEVADGAEDHITARERQVLALIASGKSSKEIAAQLGIAFRTAVCHRYRLQKKLQAHNTADLTRAAMRMRLIEL